MFKMAPKTLIEQSLFFLDGSGLNPLRQNLWSHIRTTIMFSILGSLLIEHLMDVIFNWQGLDSMQPIAATVTVQLGLHRLANLIINRKRFVQLLAYIKTFGISTSDRGFIKMQADYANIGNKLIKSAVAFIGLTSTVVFLTPIIFRIKWIPLPLYHYSTESPYFELMNLFLFFASVTIAIFVLLPNEFLFASLLLHLVCELRIVKEQIKTAALCKEEKTALQRVRIFVEQHNLVLRCIKELSTAYSGIFLNQFVSTTIGLCAALITVISGSLTDWTYLFSYFTISSIFVSQLFMYCLAGTLLMEECTKVSAGAYNSMWWRNSYPKLGKVFVLIIQRAQNVTALTAEGMVPVNIQTFTSVLQAVYSFYSVVISLYKDSKQA